MVIFVMPGCSRASTSIAAVIARSDSDEAIQIFDCRSSLDCFAPLAMTARLAPQPFFAARFLGEAFLAVFFADDRDAFFGTLAPSRRASDSPIAMACLRLLTVRPERPLFNVPALRSFIARPTLADAFLEYCRVVRAMNYSPVGTKIITAITDGSEWPRRD
jgi:hypothetical protein